MKRIVLPALVMAMAMASCEKMLPEGPDPEQTLAEPVDGLTGAQLALHVRGDEQFARNFGESEGLGPVFVQSSCQSCHKSDGKGSPFNNLTRFGQYTTSGAWDPMLSQGGPQLQHRSISAYLAEEIPAGASFTRLIAPNVSGSGFLEAVDDALILSMADSTDSNGDGISGKPQWVEAPSYLHLNPWQLPVNGMYVGRFGRKAGAIDLFMQTVNAYKQDMGITSPYDLHDPLNYAVSNQGGDAVPDPEIGSSVVDEVAFYIRTLKPPPRRNEDNADVIAGENIFIAIGCEGCHRSQLETGNSPVEALRNKIFYPYTDLLLHDMGTELDDNYTEGTALTGEWRTTPLWGLGLQTSSQGGSHYLMHDGRAGTYDEAILLHGGEGAAEQDFIRHTHYR